MHARRRRCRHREKHEIDFRVCPFLSVTEMEPASREWRLGRVGVPRRPESSPPHPAPARRRRAVSYRKFVALTKGRKRHGERRRTDVVSPRCRRARSLGARGIGPWRGTVLRAPRTAEVANCTNRTLRRPCTTGRGARAHTHTLYASPEASSALALSRSTCDSAAESSW